MSEHERPHSPEEARRKGLDQLERDQPHHPTTEHSTVPLESEWSEAAPHPPEEHRGGPLPNQKR